MSGLPREILKWMQSLDLSYSVKNVKRDFANGFLIAEMLSRYYKSEVALHSFDTGVGLVKRLENWALLEKAFRKLGFPIERKLMEEVIHCKAGAAVPLVEQLYTLLTHKTVQASRPQRDAEFVPAFARPTASALIKERMGGADLSALGHLDQTLAPGAAKQVLATHMQRLKLERELDPARFAPSATVKPSPASKRTPSSGAPVQFKEVQVRQVDDRGGVMQLRANHVYNQPFATAASTTNSQPISAPASPSQAYAAPATAAAPVSSFAPSFTSTPANNGPTVLSVLSQALLALTAGTPAGAHLTAAAEAGKEASVIYADSLISSLPDEHNAGLLHALHGGQAQELAEAALANPKEFWILAGWLLGLMAKLPAESQAFYQAIQLFSGVGLRLVARDAYVSSGLFLDFAFARLLALLRDQPQKIFQAAKLVYTFVAEEALEHVKVLEAVRTALQPSSSAADDTPTRVFYSVLAALAPYENALLVAHDYALLRAYLGFVESGLSASNSARVRAVALSSLTSLSANPSYGESVLRPILDLLRPLLPEQGATGRGLANNEWVIDAELLHVLACVLNHAWVQTAPDVLAEAHAWIEALLHPAAAVPTVRAGLAHLVHVLGQQPALRRVWLAPLLERDELRRSILGIAPSSGTTEEEEQAAEEEEVPLSVESSAAALATTADLVELFCPPLRAVWHPLTVAQTLADAVRVSRLDNLASGHIDLLAACSEDAFGSASSSSTPAHAPFVSSEAGEWCRLFLALRDHLVVELCDGDLCEAVIGVLRRFLFDARTSQKAQSIFLPNDAPPADESGADGEAASSLPAPPPLYCIMRFMYPEAAEDSQLSLAAFLEELASSPSFVGLVHKNLAVFAENEPTKYADSPLVALLEKLERQAQEAQQ